MKKKFILTGRAEFEVSDTSAFCNLQDAEEFGLEGMRDLIVDEDITEFLERATWTMELLAHSDSQEAELIDE